MSEKKPNVKKRHWCFVVYPESAPEDWRTQLEQRGIVCAISPLHDKDINPDGTPKKAHWHVIACYDGPTTFNAVKTITDSLNQPIPQPLDSVKGYYRYLTHMDNPEKHQYDAKDITTINGFDVRDYISLTGSQIIDLKMKIQKLIRDMDIDEYSDLMFYLLDQGLYSEYEVASTQTIFFNALIRSRRHSKEKS